MSGIIAPFYGATSAPAGTPQLDDRTITGESETAGFRMDATGDLLENFGPGDMFADYGDWLAPKEGMNQFEVRATLVDGQIQSGSSSPLATWLNLGTVREWNVRTAGPTRPDTTATLTIEIRPVGGVTVESATIIMTGFYDS